MLHGLERERMPDLTWQELNDFARSWAAMEVDSMGAVRPALFAFREEEFLGAVQLRPHPPGGYQAPMIEALALLVPLGADRLAFLGGGRAWSLDDPIPPVTDDADLRQQVAMLVAVDGHELRDPTMRSVLMPFEMGPEGPRWTEPFEIDEPAHGPIARLLTVPLLPGLRMDEDDLGIGRQALRLLHLGHDLQLPSPGVDARLASCLLDAFASETRATRNPTGP